jgi:hypothetical protein
MYNIAFIFITVYLCTAINNVMNENMMWFLQEKKQYVHDYKYQIHELQFPPNMKLLYIYFPRLQTSSFF